MSAARKKTTIHLKPAPCTSVRGDEAAAGRRELRAMLDSWTEDALGLDEDDAIELATREVHAYRSKQRAKQPVDPRAAR